MNSVRNKENKQREKIMNKLPKTGAESAGKRKFGEASFIKINKKHVAKMLYKLSGKDFKDGLSTELFLLEVDGEISGKDTAIIRKILNLYGLRTSTYEDSLANDKECVFTTVEVWPEAVTPKILKNLCHDAACFVEVMW